MAMTNPAFLSTQYGAPIGEYRSSTPRRVFLSIIGVALLALGVFFATYAASSAGASGDTGGMISSICVGVLFIAGALYSFFTLFTWRGAHAQLFERGFMISRAGKTISGGWDDITSVTQNVVRMRYNGIPVWTSHQYTITLANGSTLRINNAFGQVGKLGSAVQRMSANVLLPRAIASFQNGASLPFGKLSISQAGISNGSETLPWSDLNQLTFSNGRIIITRKDKRMRWFATPIS
ncbi:MAG TPA: DUF6585 family protein, partial [Ktedonobacterales bacterium]|nr:DUF6585 family protein [Ktedonobacterales bacterium]